jgi:hypothetical protein
VRYMNEDRRSQGFFSQSSSIFEIPPILEVPRKNC